MRYVKGGTAASFLAAATLFSGNSVRAADQTPPIFKAKPIADVPFFFTIDDRLTYSYIFNGTDPGFFSKAPNGTVNGKTAEQVYSFSHFDAWAYGTNVFNISMYKSNHNDPAAPCIAPGESINFLPASCSGETSVYGLVRSTFGFNEIFNTKAFTTGPLHNVSLEIGADGSASNTFTASAKRDFVAGLQFAFDLPYKGYIDVAPLYYKEIGHNSFEQCGLFAPGIPGVTCIADGNTDYRGTWAVETNYYMDLGFLPENMQYFSISGRATWHGKKGDQYSPLTGVSGGAATAVEFNSEPIRLTLDASKALMGKQYSHLVDVWVAYRYWQNKGGYDHAVSSVCVLPLPGSPSNNTCTESSLYTGVTVKF